LNESDLIILNIFFKNHSSESDAPKLLAKSSVTDAWKYPRTG